MGKRKQERDSKLKNANNSLKDLETEAKKIFEDNLEEKLKEKKLST